MKPTLYTALILFSLGFSISTEAQTAIAINTSTTSSASFGGNICPSGNCVITIAPAAVFTIDNATSCNTCVFTGGTVIIGAGSNLSLSGVDSFNNSKVFINQAFSQGGNVTFYGDTVAFNASMNLANARIDIDSSRVSVNSDLTLNKGTIYKDSLHLNANITFTNATDSFAYSHVTVGSGFTINTNTSNFISSTFDFQGSSSMSVANGMTSTGSNYYLEGTSTISSGNTTSLTNDNIQETGSKNGFTTTNAVTTSNTTVAMSSTISSKFTGGSLTSTNGSFTGSPGSNLGITNAATMTGTAVTFGSNATFTAGSLTTTNGSITAGTGSIVGITNSLTSNGTVTSLNNATLFSWTTSLRNGSFTATNSEADFGTLTLNTTSFNGDGATISSANAIVINNTTTSLNNSSFTGNSFATTGGTFTSTSTTVSSTNAATMTNTTTSYTGGSFSANSLAVTGGSFGLAGTSASSGNAVTIDGVTMTMSGGSNLSGNSATIRNHSTVTMSGTSVLTSTNALTVDNSALYLNGNNRITANSMGVTTGSWVRIGDGTLASTARINITNTFNVDLSSNLGISNNNNYLYIPNGPGALPNNTISCGGGGTQHACATGFVYGCGTINNNVGVQCVVLATADINLTASSASPGQVGLTFIDREASTADHYFIQRNTGDNQWNTTGTVAAGGYTAGEYRYTDANAPSGSIEYRIQRIDQNGKTGYSSIVTVNVGQAGSSIAIHPNPAIGGVFYITTPNSSETMVNIYTMTGQILLHTSLNGQNQYAIHLPAQTLGAVMVQTIGQTGTHSFTVLVK